jgi:uncharacterized protein
MPTMNTPLTDLASHILNLRLIDTHEHMCKETDYLENGPDVLEQLFHNYPGSDLVVAGASEEAMKRLFDRKDTDIAGRFRGIQAAWETMQFTGYGEGVRLAAKRIYELDELTPEGLAAAQTKNQALRKPGERLRLLRDVANLDHIQTDDFRFACLPDASGPDFFLYDISWAGFSNGNDERKQILAETGIEVRDLTTLRSAMEVIFSKYGSYAIAVKSQHAYNRTLRWEERDEADVARVLDKRLGGAELDEAEKLVLGDWSLARGVELAIQHNLPFKIHTGYYAGSGYMRMDRISAENLCPLLIKYPKARFVLMHVSYPYSDEIVALAKHFPNVYIDMCWAWSIDPYSCANFVRQMVHASPANKLFAFGGDSFWPAISVGYSIQCRRWLTRALEAEVRDGLLTEKQGIDLATRWMRGNQEACFDIAGTRAAIRETIERD